MKILQESRLVGNRKKDDIMDWEIVKIPMMSRGRTVPYASVGYGRLSLNVAACELVDDYETFSYVLLRKNRAKNSVCVGVQFLKEFVPDAIQLSRKKIKHGKKVGGIELSNRTVLESLFGTIAAGKQATRYNVKKDETFENFVVVFNEEQV